MAAEAVKHRGNRQRDARQVLTIHVGNGGYGGGFIAPGAGGVIRIVWGPDRWFPAHNVSGYNY